MKKIFCLITTFLFTSTVHAEEIQLSDYVFKYAKRLYHSYSYAAYNTHYWPEPVRYDNSGPYTNHMDHPCPPTENNIIKPNGTLLYPPAEYNSLHGRCKYIVSGKSFSETFVTPQFVEEDYLNNYFMVYGPVEPYNKYFFNPRFSLMSADGELITELGYGSLCSVDHGFYRIENTVPDPLFLPEAFDTSKQEVGIYDLITKKLVLDYYETIDPKFSKTYRIFYSRSTDTFALIVVKRNNDYTIEDLDLELTFIKDGKEGEHYTFQEKPNTENHPYDYLIEGYEELNSLYDEDARAKKTFMSKTDEPPIGSFDDSYTFKSKQINGAEYYALFKELGENETAADYAPAERPSAVYADAIDKMAAEKLLFNNEMCFYDHGITKLDFGIAAARAFCVAVGYDIENYKTETEFVDVKTPYCMLLTDMGVLSYVPDSDLFIHEQALTQGAAAQALDLLAEKCGVSDEWAAAKTLPVTEDICTREKAYAEIYKLYGIIKQAPENGRLSIPVNIITPETTTEEPTTAKTTKAETTTKTTSETTAAETANKPARTAAVCMGILTIGIIAIFAYIKKKP